MVNNDRIKMETHSQNNQNKGKIRSNNVNDKKKTGHPIKENLMFKCEQTQHNDITINQQKEEQDRTDMNKLDQKPAMKIGYGGNEIASTTHFGDDKNDDDNNSKVYVR